jgi:hypothetical protein
MNRKLVLISLIVIAVLMVGVVYGLSGQTLSSATSPDGKYKVEVSQTRHTAGIERYVYLSAYRDGKQFVRSKLIYTGDFLDGDFSDLYPNYSWASPSVLKLGRTIDATESNGLRITNKSQNRISYLLVETYFDKYVLFDLEPQSVVDLKFEFLGRLSCQGEFVESKERFGSAVALSSGAENKTPGDFLIKVDGKNAVIESSSLQLKQVTCCAVDRPDINHESYWMVRFPGF